MSTTIAATRFHHLANGSATTELIARAGLAGTTSIWADPLHEGPVPAGVDDRELLAIRAGHLAAGSDASAGEVAAELERWRAALDDRSAYDELVLWYEHDLFDQLNLIQALARSRETAARECTISLICIGEFPGRPSFKGLGELTPAELAPLLETRRPVTEAQYALADRAWSAFRSPDPRALERLLEADTSALPFLSPALRRHLEELPWTIDGLSRTERRVLELAGAAPIEVWEAFRRVSEGETAFYVADRSFWRIVTSLESAVPPLLVVDAPVPEAKTLPRGTLALTDTGRAVLDGTVDRVAGCGIDRWLGGVHLAGRGELWRWDSEGRRVVWR